MKEDIKEFGIVYGAIIARRRNVRSNNYCSCGN